MRVAIVNESLPYPPNAGNRIRTLNLMQRLAKRHEITYVCRAADTAEETKLGVDYLKGQGIRPIIADEAPARRTGVPLYAALAGNLLGREPYAVSSHNSPRLRQRIKEMARAGEVDLWQFEWLAYADAVAGVPGARTLVIAHNVETLIWQRYYETETSFAKRQYLRTQWRKWMRYERGVFAKVDGVVCVSEEDARLARADFSPRRASVVDNGIDRAFFEQATGKRDPNTILFLGSLEWRPNLDALRLLLDSIFPAVLRQAPATRLQIVGRRPPQWLKDAVAGKAQIELHADVPDVRAYLATAGVMAVPLRVGGGSRLKILEALACGLPVVSTDVGSEGLATRHGVHLINADVERFAGALVEAMQNHEEAIAIAEAGRKLVYQRYDWDVLATRLENTWTALSRLDEAAHPRVEVSPQAALG